jgi:hypothetical protein
LRPEVGILFLWNETPVLDLVLLLPARDVIHRYGLDRSPACAHELPELWNMAGNLLPTTLFAKAQVDIISADL